MSEARGIAARLGKVRGRIERACELAVGSADGLVRFESAVKAVTQGAFVAAR